MKKTFFAVAAVIISSQLLAQEDTTGKSLDEAIVTANKYPNKASLTGKVLTVITRQQLERSGGKDLSQLLNEQPGVYINGSNSNPGKDKSVFVRGARVDHTLITIDGIPIYDPSGIGNNFDIRNIPIDNIERIEILKGSQSTLYGSDAIASVINIITKKGGQKTIGGTALASYGSNNTFRGQATVNGKTGVFDYNAGYTFFDTKGINEAIENKVPSRGDKDGYQQNSLLVNLGIQASSKVRIQPFFRYTKLEGDLDQGAFTDELDYTFSQKSWQTGLRNEFTLGKTKLNVLYSFNHIDRLYTDDSTKSRNGFYKYSRGTYKGGEHIVDAYAHIPLASELKLTAGADFRTSNTDQDYFSVSSFGAGSNPLGKDSLRQNQFGVYAALNYAHPNGFTIEGGGRFNNHSEYGSNFVFNVNPSYLLAKQLKIFANLSTGYRTPSLYQLFSEYGNKDLQPEVAFTFEGGAQFFSSDDKLSTRAVFFSRNVKDAIFFYFNPVTFQSQYINQDKQKDHGVELELKYNISKTTTLRTFYTYNTGKITTVQNGKDTTFFNLLRRPKTSFGLNLGSQVCKNFYVSTNLQQIGERKDAYYDAAAFRTVNVTLSSYVLWDIYAEYGFLKNKLKVFADLRNITNSKYTEVSGFNTLRFNGYGGVRYSF